MFCGKCGTNIPDGVSFCPNCGNQVELIGENKQKVTPSSSGANAYNSSSVGIGTRHPYHQLGGWLLFIVICLWLGVVINIVGAIKMISVISTLNSYGLHGAAFGVILYIAVLLAMAYSGAKVALMIQHKDPGFLKLYHYMMIACIIVEFILYLVLSSVEISIAAVLSSVFAVVIYTLYFINSVRVRTYMGTDEYLRLSPITKNVTAPSAADI